LTTREPAITTQEAGRQAEARAENYLLKKGFSTVNRNYSWKTGEIDLIMEKRTCWYLSKSDSDKIPIMVLAQTQSPTPSKQKLLIQLNDIFRLPVINGRAIDSMLYQ